MFRFVAFPRTTDWASFKIKRMMSLENVVKSSEVNKAVLTLNRPKKLNSLNMDMIKQMCKSTKEWQNTKSLVIIKSDLETVFCAGGDVKAMTQDPIEETQLFLRTAYTYNYFTSIYPIPYVAFISGLTMGGGVGVTVHGPYRVATENTIFAMPETQIGYFPDVGASHFLSRLHGALGMYLGLTGTRLKGKDVFHAGIATHFCEAVKLPELEQALVSCENKADVEGVLAKFCPVDPSSVFSLKPHLNQIDSCFSANSVEDILGQLQQDNSPWAQTTLKALALTSPKSLKVCHRQLTEGRNLDLAGCIKMELRMVYRYLEDYDFIEGVRAKLIEKDNSPKWKYDRLEKVPEELVRSYFEPFDNSAQELNL